ncbi:hypothetical protein [Butyrivibrio sp. AE2032]|uniref:hypothetical protein n=1 Tax=Butyrivibrio sp. AE2032 TaxID=1458463 RepID=UPI000555670C|nr:hypothetical protein [Butyrivibrio sp. AE2032]
MNYIKKFTAVSLSILLGASALTGCGASDKSAVKEASEGFMNAIKNNDKDGINTWSDSEVANGYFVSLFDADYLEEQLLTSLNNPTLEEDTVSRLDDFYKKYEAMMEEYEVTEVTVGKDGTATAQVTMKTSFPFDVVTSDETSAKFNEASQTYNSENQDELLKLSEEQGSDAAVSKAYNDLILIAVDTYEEAIAASDSVTYKLVLNLAKNEETGSWYVTSVQSYDSSVAGTGAPATNTNTSATEVSTTDVSVESNTESSSN